jgi:hypothetical protein
LLQLQQTLQLLWHWLLRLTRLLQLKMPMLQRMLLRLKY